MTCAEVTEVRDEPADGAVLLGSAIERPAPGWDTERHALEISGWALGARQRVVRVEVLSGNELVQSFPVGRWSGQVLASFPGHIWSSTAGFSGLLATLELESEFELALRAVLADGTTAAIGTIAGWCEDLASGYEPVLEPLLVTSLGRSGSTILMHLLSQAGDVVCGSSYPYELRIGKYWLQLLAVATSPADVEHSVTRDGVGASPFWVGRNPFHDDTDVRLRQWLETEHVQTFASFVQQQIDQAYGVVGTVDSLGTGPRYFAEKTGPGRSCRLAHRLYSGSRELFLVRDFRDVYCSVVAFNDARGYDGFGRDTFPNDVEYLRSLGEAAQAMLAAWRARRSKGMLVRYEDLVRDRISAVKQICDHLNLSAADVANDPDEIVRRAQSGEGGLSGHRTTTTVEESIGRWRRDLPDELRSASAEFLDEPLLAFGYEPTT